MDKLRIILIALTAMILMQCKSSLEINGIWMETKLTKKNNEQFSIFGRKLFDFHKDSVLMTSIGNLQIPDLKANETIKGSYKVRSNKLVLRAGQEKLRTRLNFTDDSLNLTIRKFDNDKITLKRLQERDKCDIQKNSFTGKSFLLSIGNYTDSIFFLNDTLMLHCGNKAVPRPLESWELSDYKGYKIFHTTDPFLPGMVVSKYSNKTITLNPYIKSNLNVKLIQSNSLLSITPLIGTWVETERKTISTLSYGSTKESLRLIIEIDKINIIKNTRPKTMDWRITPDLSRIYFISDEGEYVDSWKIIELSDTTLKLRITDKTGMEDYLAILTKE